MAKITFISFDGKAETVETTGKRSVMEVARQSDITAIAADCGGSCACATCHVYVDSGYLHKLAPASDMELGLLDFVVDRRENSRLSCQIQVNEELDGLVVHTPESQY